MAQTTEAVRLCKHLIGFVLQIFKSSEFAENVSPAALQSTVVALLTYVQDSKLARLGEGKQVTRALNLIILKVLQSVKPNLGLSMLMGVLADALGASASTDTQMIQLVQRCMWKLVKGFTETIESIDLAALLVRITDFFLAVSEVSDDNDLPVRTATSTVHPIVQQMVKLKGEEVGRCLAALEQTRHAQLVRTMVLQAMTAEGLPLPVDTGAGADLAASALPDQTNAQKESELVIIFAMITSKEETKQGMMKLYDFQERYPSTDFTKFLETTSPFFQNHIKRSLEDIRKRKATMSTRSAATPSNLGRTTAAKSASSYLDQLRKLTHKPTDGGAGVRDPLGTVQPRMGSPTKFASTTQMLSSVNKSPTRPSPTKEDVSQLDSLKARLARLKSK